jgi:hypothetical protein
MRRSSSSAWGALGAWALAALLLGACTAAPDQTRQEGGLTVGVKTDPSPAELGEGHFTFFVEADGKPVPDADVTYRMFMPGMQMSTDDTWTGADAEGKGRYAGKGDFAMGGAWVVEVTVRRRGKEPVSVRFPFEIKWELK